jgi:hypothetical protein
MQIDLQEVADVGVPDVMDGIPESGEGIPGTLILKGVQQSKPKEGSQKITLIFDRELHIEGIEYVLGQDDFREGKFFVVRNDKGFAATGRDRTGNEGVMRLIGPALGIGPKPALKDVIDRMQKGVDFDSLPTIPVRVTRWSGGINVYPQK